MLRHAKAVGCKAIDKNQSVTLEKIEAETDGDFRKLVETCSAKVLAAALTPEKVAERAAKSAKKAAKEAAEKAAK